MKKKNLADKTYYIFGEVDNDVEKFRSVLNNFLYLKKRIRNIKKYELLNALVLTGLKHKEEALGILGIYDFDTKETE